MKLTTPPPQQGWVEENEEMDQRRPDQQSGRDSCVFGKIYSQIVTSQNPGHQPCVHRVGKMKRNAG